ncbi:MAG: PilZ domain-containing protein [Nitrospirae bacterium]|nr:PilZ domain-containing protein [Nitrospirota bacterium]
MERRLYPRADADVLIKVRLLAHERQAEYFSKIYDMAAVADIASRSNTASDSDPEDITRCMVDLQENADSMVKIFSGTDNADGFCDLAYKQINISSGGVRFFCDTMCRIRDLVELRVILPVQPPVPLYVYGEVVRVLETEDGYAVAVEFIATSDEIRREIVHFINTLLETK